MELTIVQPLKIRMPEGPKMFHPGQIIDLPDNVALRLLELAPEKVRRMDDVHFSVGQRVRYQIPTQIKSPTEFSWKEYVGKVELVDFQSHLALIIPEVKDVPWLWVNFAYIQTMEP